MQISLRSQMIAGATAVVGATAIAMTPVAPAVSIPSLSTAKADVALSALANPLGALIDTGLVLGNYVLNGAYTTPEANWPGSGIGAIINGVVPTYGVVTPGLLPNIIATPFPVLTTLATNWVGYGYIGAASVGSALAEVSNIIWSIPATAVQVGLDLLTLDFAQALADVQSAIQGAINSGINAVNDLISGATTIFSSIVTKAQAVVQFLLEDAGQVVGIVSGQLAALAASVSGTIANVVAGASDPNPIEGVWNALVEGLLDATVVGSIPASVINLSAGAGQQVNPLDPTTFVPSIRTVGTGLLNGVAGALNTPVPTPGAAVRAAAAVKAAPVAEAAPAAEAAPTAADVREDAAEASVATPAAAASESAAAADSSPAPSKGKAAAKSGGRG